VKLNTSLPIDEAIEKYGHVPLPPYITRADQPADVERYQTVYANESGSVAAPTAGLHFTPEMLDALVAKRVKRADLLFTSAAGTFQAGRGRAPRRSRHARGVVHAPGASPRKSSTKRERVVERSGRSARPAPTLESAIGDDGSFGRNPLTPASSSGRPTSFAPSIAHHQFSFCHVRRSSCSSRSFAGYDLTMRAYQEAVAERYRLYSYGDAMVIL